MNLGKQNLSLRRISQSEIRKSSAAESEGGQKFLPPQPPSFLPARAFSFAREARHQFRSKKVRISSNKRIFTIKPAPRCGFCKMMRGVEIDLLYKGVIGCIGEPE